MDSGPLPGVMPTPSSLTRPSGVTRARRSILPSEHQILPSGPSAIPSGEAVAVGAKRNADRHAVAVRKRKFVEHPAIRVQAADLAGAALAEPKGVLRPFDRNVGAAVRRGNLVLADDRLI